MNERTLSQKLTLAAAWLVLALVSVGLSLATAYAAPPTIDRELRPTLREWSAAEAIASDIDGVLQAVTDDESEQTIAAADLTNPPCPRNITVTAGGTAGDIAAVSITVRGLRQGKPIEEEIGPFTVNTTGTIAGSKIFDRVTEVVIPAHDGTGATTSVGFGELLGLPHPSPYPHIIAAYKNAIVDSSATLTVSSNLEGNYLDLSTNLSGVPVSLIYLK